MRISGSLRDFVDNTLERLSHYLITKETTDVDGETFKLSFVRSYEKLTVLYDRREQNPKVTYFVENMVPGSRERERKPLETAHDNEPCRIADEVCSWFREQPTITVVEYYKGGTFQLLSKTCFDGVEIAVLRNHTGDYSCRWSEFVGQTSVELPTGSKKLVSRFKFLF